MLGLLGRAALVVLGMCALLLGWRKSQRAQRPGPIDVVAEKKLSATHALFVVNVEGRSLLLGTSPHGLSTLCDLSESPAPNLRDEPSHALDAKLPLIQTTWPQPSVEGSRS
jgi:hypothetical protein